MVSKKLSKCETYYTAGQHQNLEFFKTFFQVGVLKRSTHEVLLLKMDIMSIFHRNSLISLFTFVEKKVEKFMIWYLHNTIICTSCYLILKQKVFYDRLHIS